MKCSYCGGSLLDEPDPDVRGGTRRVCMSCGREAEIPVPELIAHNAEWKTYALGHLNDLIKQVTDMESVKREAEGVAAARSAAATPNVPDLPWKATKKPMGRPRKNVEVAA